MTGSGEEQTALFADIVGSTRITEESGDYGARDILSSCLDLMEEIVEKRGGRVSRRIGDELLCLFPNADTAATASLELHAVVSSAHRKGTFPRPMRLRIGFEHGQVVEHERELFGITVNTAARLSSMAKAGQTLITKDTLDRLSPVLRMFSRHFDSVILKGFSGEQEIYDLPWNTQATTKAGGSAAAPRRAIVNAAVELEYDGASYRVDAEQPRLDIGRDPACDLAVTGSSVSMMHARVMWNRGKVRIEDVSTNGTTIQRDNGLPVTLHHQAASLLGAGQLYLGESDETAGARIRFRCLSN